MRAPQFSCSEYKNSGFFIYRSRAFLSCNFFDNRPNIENLLVITYQGDDRLRKLMYGDGRTVATTLSGWMLGHGEIRDYRNVLRQAK